jgi:hypothetical protein
VRICADFVAFGAEIGRVVRELHLDKPADVAVVHASPNLDLRCDEIVASSWRDGRRSAPKDPIEPHATIEP